jgi:hypothetical protein
MREGDLHKLPERGCGLVQALKVINGAFEKIVDSIAAGEPGLEVSLPPTIG